MRRRARTRWRRFAKRLAAGVALRSGGRSAFGGKAENICLILSLSGFDRVVGPGADIPSPEQLVAAHIPLGPFQDPDGCETMPCVVLTPGATMRRREFITLVGGTAVAWPLAARAQQAGKLPTIGVLGTGSLSTWARWTAAFALRLRQLGWTEGRTVAIEYRWAEGRSERFAEIAAEFVQLKVDVILTGGAGVPAAKRATSAIPIVFAIAADPLGTGLVASLAQPGGNITGLSTQAKDLAGKRVELLREVLPLRRLAIMGNVEYPAAVLEIGEVQAAARTFGLEVDLLEIRRADDISPAIGGLKSGAQALYVCPDAVVNANHARINALALGARLLTAHSERAYLEGGGFMAYGPSYTNLFRRAAELVDKILRGAKPGDIPVEQPTKFDLVISLVAAKALGLSVPLSLLARADEVIE